MSWDVKWNSKWFLIVLPFVSQRRSWNWPGGETEQFLRVFLVSIVCWPFFAFQSFHCDWEPRTAIKALMNV